MLNFNGVVADARKRREPSYVQAQPLTEAHVAVLRDVVADLERHGAPPVRMAEYGGVLEGGL